MVVVEIDVSGANSCKSGNTSLTLGYIELAAFALIASSSFLFAPVGAKLAHRLPETGLRNSFALLLFGLAVMMFMQ